MLHIKKVEMHGFKSFADREELRFQGSGVAAIVGPNGCGKSNVADAISWVLGERSAKSLRGTRMEDVIFSGSSNRRASGLAAVSLTLSDPEAQRHSRTNGHTNGHAPANGENGIHTNGTNGTNGVHELNASLNPFVGLPEITVTRKLFRSGESTYLINGKTVRLRDIQDLFMGTGLGPDHYAIIEQGRVGQILSTRPVDRRSVIEEAAGVTRFKTKKRLAELKLESSKVNLNRVNDILQEVSRQVNSLKRQAARARRYATLREEANGKLKVVLANRWRQLDAAVRAAEAEKQAAGAAFQALSAEAETLDKSQTQLRAQVHSSETTLQRVKDEHSQAAMEGERLASRIEEQERKAGDLQARAKHAGGELEQLDQRIQAVGAEFEAERAAVEQISGEASAVKLRLESKSGELQTRQRELRESQARQEELRQKTFRVLGEVSSLRNQLAKIEEFLAGLGRQVARTKDEETTAREELSQLAQLSQQLEAQIEGKQTDIERLGGERTRLEKEIAQQHSAAKEHRRLGDEVRNDLSRQRARRDSLDEILSHHAYTTETVKNLFTAIGQTPVEGFKPAGILADFIEVDGEYERAAEDFLRNELEFVVVKSWDEAERGLSFLRSELHGHLTVLVEPAATDAHVHAKPAPAGVRGCLADHVRFTNGLTRAPAQMLDRLAACFLVDNEGQARALGQSHPGLAFLLPNGSWYQGCTLSGGRKATAGPLALKRELRELGPRIAALETRLEAVTRAASEAEDIAAHRTGELDALKSELQRLEKDAVALEQQARQYKEQSQRADRRLTVTVKELERLQGEASRGGEQRDEVGGRIEQREKERVEFEEALRESLESAKSVEAALATLSEDHARLRAEQATLEERRRSATASLERVRNLRDEHQERRKRIAGQKEQWEAERARLLADNTELTRRREQSRIRREALSKQVDETTTALATAREKTIEIEEAMRAKRAELEQSREQRGQIELRVVELRGDVRRIDEESQRELQTALATIAADAESLDADALAAAEADYLGLKERIEKIGPVNLLALEEFDEANARFEFLDTQRTDLLTSVRDTQQAIREIDTESRRQFQAAFTAINANFGRMFQTLFGGGAGEMRLTDPDNPGESGIDIVASPPGKRLQNVMLLSGGEKSLTALALLMATFQYKPSPFCVLDEVDAALDEANVMRFRRLIEEMDDQTQFIVITHAKTTMEAAQSLYGVTMQEPGVSKLVSVRLGEHRATAPTPPASGGARVLAVRA